jgi:peptide deformylase
VSKDLLKITRLGNPILREAARHLTPKEIMSKDIQKLIADMKELVASKKYGVGLAAPQVGQSIALSVIAIKPTPNRPDAEPFESVIINPMIVETHGYRKQLWEGCISAGRNNDTMFALVPRYKSIRVRWYDEAAKRHEKTLTGIQAHVAQHEIDHLNGVIFVDKVKDTKSFMMADEFRKRVAKKLKQK